MDASVKAALPLAHPLQDIGQIQFSPNARK